MRSGPFMQISELNLIWCFHADIRFFTEAESYQHNQTTLINFNDFCVSFEE